MGADHLQHVREREREREREEQRECVVTVICKSEVHSNASSTKPSNTHSLLPPPPRECCLLVLNTVTSTPQWIRQPKPRGCVFVFVCKYVLGRSRATQPPNLRLCLLRHFGFLTSPHAIPTRSGCHPNSFRLLRRSTSAPHPIPRAHFLHLPTSPRLSLCTSTMTTYLTTA
jgi:hypothetical protein